MEMLKPEYFLMIFMVSSSVLKLFIRTSGTLASYFLLRNSICWTVRSRKVRSFLTGMTDFGPLQPMLVPRPPFSLITTSFSSILLMLSLSSGSGNSRYGVIWQHDKSLLLAHS